MEIRKSGIRGAGKGLFASQTISKGDEIGDFSGTLVCACCVKKKRLAKRDGRFTVIECGRLVNDHDEEVLWYLYRSHSINYGVCWYINSASVRNKLFSQKQPNCHIVNNGFTEDGIPLITCVAIVDIEHGTELLTDYIDS